VFRKNTHASRTKCIVCSVRKSFISEHVDNAVVRQNVDGRGYDHPGILRSADAFCLTFVNHCDSSHFYCTGDGSRFSIVKSISGVTKNEALEMVAPQRLNRNF
jgi:hypothetical protein